MNKDNGEQMFDDDILQSKAEILRLKGSIVPPFGRPPKREPQSHVEKTQVPASLSENTSLSKPKNDVEPVSRIPAEAAFSDTAAFTPPRFDVPGQTEFALHHEEIEDANNEEDEIAEPQEVNGDGDIDELEAAEIVKDGQESGEDSEIPEFDLAKQIMAAQRKISGERRKGPGSQRFEIREEKSKSPTAPAPRIRPAVPLRNRPAEAAPMSPQQRLIAEIVAKDINKFYQGIKVSK